MESSEKEFGRDELVALIRERRDTNARLEAEVLGLKQRIKELEGKHPTKRLNAPYSVRSEEQRQAKSKKVRKKKTARKPKRRGRRTTCEKVDLADRIEPVLPDGFSI